MIGVRISLASLLFAQATLAFAQKVRLEPQRISSHCFFQSESGVASLPSLDETSPPARSGDELSYRCGNDPRLLSVALEQCRRVGPCLLQRHMPRQEPYVGAGGSRGQHRSV